LGLLIGTLKPVIIGIPVRVDQVQKPGKEFGPKTAFLDSLPIH
jgi:hypothetical protein